MLDDAHIYLNSIRAEAKAVTPIHFGYGMSVGSPVKNVETSSPATTRQARSYAPQRLATAITDAKARLNLYLSGYGVLHAVKNRETPEIGLTIFPDDPYMEPRVGFEPTRPCGS